MSYVVYSSNNSGGDWWLKDEDWKALEADGWVVSWRHERWLGALATKATLHHISLWDAIRRWEKATKASAEDEGCPCCGQPHYFEEYDEHDQFIRSC